MKLRANTLFLIGTFILFALAVAIFNYYEYQQNKIELYRQIDEKLLTSAEGAALVLSTDFYERAIDASSISKSEDERNIERLSRFAKAMKVVYVYTMIQKNGKIYFTSSSATDEERKSGINLTRYFDNYDDASDTLKNVFRTHTKQFAEYTDKWGTFRSIFLPMKNQKGETYVIGADVRIDTINHILNERTLNRLLNLSIVTLLSLPFFTWRLRRINSNLQEENEVLGQEVELREKNLKQNDIQLQAILDATQESIFLLDKNGIVLTMNSTAAERLNCKSSDIIGHCVYDFFPLDVAKRRRSNVEKIVSTGETLSTEDCREEKIFALNYYPVFDENNSVSSVVVFAQEITARKQAEDHIYHLSNFDALTGLPNRQKLLLDMEQSQPNGCAIFNIDNFKELNDFFGITSGDILLRVVGEWFKTMGFYPYRIGGDEFALLFYDDLTPEKLHIRMSALIAALDEERFVVENETLDVRMSAGAAIGSHKLLTRADIALHTAKERKIPIAFYEESENVEKQYHTNIAMATTIRKALANGRILCHYQPIVNVITGEIDKYETLVRMTDDEGNTVMPMQFLPIAKKTKLYPRITKEVLHQACHLFSSRTEEFSINLSIDDIHDPSTVQDILATMTQTDTSSRIVFEILESDGIENYGEVARFIDHVKKLGGKIAIDDFGTGYSNFEHILKLNVDYIKIDGSLIREIADNPRHQIIVETIIDFAQKMGAKTIAEFVSDEKIFQTIKRYGIDYSQGYYTGRPDALE
ncbi:MAG: EAL domain-containing protein [Sulfuricurvum sp.]|uniref:putative bifunctional diguanylate cyclase/phosphodiesterase n=1 Tax=Sulfuricurvum sp. TaxID=2025608 RepID=UPI00261B3352|nr:GGDEF domain-containing phosphodiesterase [Sulfuricurvum sp.]MDD2828077.1 EAL domain-containing protein [Sulfuricurvum sp.]